MTMVYEPTLRDRLRAKRNNPLTCVVPIDVPDTGVIPGVVVATIDQLAKHAQAGDTAARDALYEALRTRLYRKGFVVRPWPNTPSQTGVWDRDDVQQESWIIFAELLAAWDGEMPFVPYLFARFAWRLRDRILRGIGRPLPPLGGVRVPEDMLVELLLAHDSDQPESAVLANKLLEHLLQGKMRGEIETLDPRSVLTILQSPLPAQPRRQKAIPDEGQPFSQSDAA